MSDWKLSGNIPKVDYNNPVYMTSYEQVNFDRRCGMWLNRAGAAADMEDMRAYKHYVVYFKVENGRYCCIQYNGNHWKTEGYRGSEQLRVALTFCSRADNKDGLPAPHTFKPLPADDPANYTYLFRLPEVKIIFSTGLPAQKLGSGPLWISA